MMRIAIIALLLSLIAALCGSAGCSVADDHLGESTVQPTSTWGPPSEPTCTWGSSTSGPPSPKQARILALVRTKLIPFVVPALYDEFERDMETCTAWLLICEGSDPITLAPMTPSWEIDCSSFMGTYSEITGKLSTGPSQETPYRPAWYLCSEHSGPLAGQLRQPINGACP